MKRASAHRAPGGRNLLRDPLVFLLNILLAWVLTIPASMLIAAALFLCFRAIIPD